MDAAVLEHEALKLSATQRALLADRLMQTLSGPDPNIIQAWSLEGERRFAAAQTGEMKIEDGDAVVETLRKRLA